MKDSYDFSEGKPGRITPEQPEQKGRVKVTIQLDEDIVEHFAVIADASGGAIGYQTLINDALRQAMETPKLEETLRRVIREELVRRQPA
jgi:uncharacterized protein (DUF4415 family)